MVLKFLYTLTIKHLKISIDNEICHDANSGAKNLCPNTTWRSSTSEERTIPLLMDCLAYLLVHSLMRLTLTGK